MRQVSPQRVEVIPAFGNVRQHDGFTVGVGALSAYNNVYSYFACISGTKNG